MKEFTITVVGLDVHKDLVVTGVLPPWSDRVTESARLENTPVVIEKLVKRVAAMGDFEAIYDRHQLTPFSDWSLKFRWMAAPMFPASCTDMPSRT